MGLRNIDHLCFPVDVGVMISELIGELSLNLAFVFGEYFIEV